MLGSLGLVLGVLVVAGATLRGLSWARRRRVTRMVPQERLSRATWGVSVRVATSGLPLLPSMGSNRTHRTTADLLLTDDRLLMVCGRGLLLDIRPARGALLASVRAPGPGRLVLEGGVTGPAQAGRYRIEVPVDDAAGWVDALSRFVAADNGGFARSTVAALQRDRPGSATR